MSIDMSESSDRIANFLAKNKVGVLATADSRGRPHAATVYVTYDRELNIYFTTKKETQKSRNLQDNPWAAIAIFDASTQTTVQAQGSVIEVNDTAQQEWIFHDVRNAATQTSHSGIPPTTQLIAGGYIVYQLAAPTLRMATFSPPDPSVNPTSIFEVVHTQPSL